MTAAAPARPRYGWDTPQRVATAAAMRRRGDPMLAILQWLRTEGYDLAPPTLGRQLPALGITLPDTIALRRGRRVTPGSNGAVPTYDTGAEDTPHVLRDAGDIDAPPSFTSNKKVGTLDWREATGVVQQMQALKRKAAGSQDYGDIDFGHVTEPIAVLALGDGHFGSFCTDYETMIRVTDEILSIPNLYVAVLGDLLQMSIKMRSVLEVSDNVLTPAMQLQYLASWLGEIAHKVLFSTWDNHSSERFEKQAGIDPYGEIFKRRVIFHSGIGHTDVKVGSQVYKFAVSHMFRGRSMFNPVHSQGRYVRHEAPDREIVMGADSHVPGVGQWHEGGALRTYINSGTAQTQSGYAKRYFSLRTVAEFPLVVLDPREHRVTPYWNVAGWLAASGRP